MKREEQRRRSRQAILDAAGEQFHRKGYTATSLADVAAQLGLVRGTVHFHFATKDGVASALREHFAQATTTLFAEHAERAGQDTADLTPLARSFASMLLTDPQARGALQVAREGRSADTGVVALLAPWRSAVRAVLTEHDPQDADLFADALFGVIDRHLDDPVGDAMAAVERACCLFLGYRADHV